MHSARILRSIDAVLDQAEAAVARADWDAAIDGARRVLAIDPTNQDAAAFLRMAQVDLDATVPSLLIAIEDEVRVHESAIEVMPEVSRIAASTASGAAAERAYAAPARYLDSDIMPTPIRGLPSTSHATAEAEIDREMAIDGPMMLGAPPIDAERATISADDIASDALTTHDVEAHESMRRRHYVIAGAYETPRRFVALSARGPLVLTAGIIAATIALTSMGRAQPETAILPASVAQPAPAGETPAPVLAVPTPVAPEVAPAPPAVPAPASVESSPPVATVAPGIIVPPRPRQYRGTFTGTLGRIVAVNGCAWDTPFEANVDATLTRAPDGTMSGTATSLVKIAYVVTYTPDGATCNASVVTNEATGPITGDDQQLSGALTGPRELAISFRGTRTDNALVGDATIQRNLGTMSTFGQTSAIGTASGTNLVLAGT